jgi:hypothetical protein
VSLRGTPATEANDSFAASIVRPLKPFIRPSSASTETSAVSPLSSVSPLISAMTLRTSKAAPRAEMA